MMSSSMQRTSRLRWAVLAVILAGSTAGCIHLFYRTNARAVAAPEDPAAETVIASPVKAHLVDGSTVVFQAGARVSSTMIRGNGQQFPLFGAFATERSDVPLDSVVGVEAFESQLRAGDSFVVSVAATAVTGVATIALLKALFGSCPTVYAASDSGPVLQAEGFSYSIAPIMERRDLDPLHLRPDAQGAIRLELRNEALETHYINHVELLAVRHRRGERVTPDQSGAPVTVGGFGRVTAARSRTGDDVLATVAAADGALYATAPETMRGAREGDLDDWIDLELADLPSGDSVAVVLRLRNSLLNTVLLYDGMLGGRDAVDWLGTGLRRLGPAFELGRWYGRTMGMRATIEGSPVEARLGDIGPLAFRDVAIVLPRAEPDAATARVRLRFVADNWRIDEVRVAGEVGRPVHTQVPVDRIEVPTPADGSFPRLDGDAQRAIAASDGRYMETRPGQRMVLVFRAPAATDAETTFLLAWQGWYREWVRGEWLASPKRTTAFIPGDAAVVSALHRWTDQQKTFERAFYATRVPVR